ncbi:MAG: DUF2298 domain-containing protein [Thermomicrobium sp.]|nr:DUF2298 domain-containing protein [Thermomicrobium sp.]MDW7981775.1 DUF2298 domain-containing protein [Thermomicrobium sp.]
MVRQPLVTSVQPVEEQCNEHGHRFVRTVVWGAVLLLALVLRVYGVGWDQWHLLHPDERFLLMVAVDRIHAPARIGELSSPSRSPWNPRAVGPDGRPQAFAYGTLPLYALETTSWLVDRSLALAGLASPGATDPYRTLALRGRVLTAVIDVIGLAFAMAIARRVFGFTASAVTGILLACSVIAIQQAHFFVVDPWAATFGIVTLWAAVRLAERGSRRWAVVAGIAYAAALACKVSMWPLIAPLILALFWSVRTRMNETDTRPGDPWLRRWRRAPWGTLIATTLATYAILEPYTVLDPRSTVVDIVREWQIARGAFDVPYTRQYVGTVPIVYQLVQLWRWGLGPTLTTVGLVAVIGAAMATLQMIRCLLVRRQAHHAVVVDPVTLTRSLLATWIVAYVLTAWTAETKYLRYSLPLVAPLAILTSGAMVSLAQHARPAWSRLARRGLVILVVAGTAAWALAFLSVYRHPHTRVEASAWIYAHVPAGATLGVEHWDDRLPLRLPGTDPDQRYRFVTLSWYDDRPPMEALRYLATSLSQVDYLVLSSDRLAGSIPRLPWRYPVTSEYYRLLETGRLGFRLVYESDRESRLGPLGLDDAAADESFTVYDHPRVRIYQKVRSLSQEELELLFEWALQQPYASQRARPLAYKALLGIPAEAVEVANDIGWAERWLSSDAAAVLAWMVLLVGLLVAGLPLATRVAGRFPDRGIGLARPLALACLAYPMWLLASWRVTPFQLPQMLPVIVIVVALIWRLGYRAMARLDWRPRWPFLLASEFAFWGTFGFFLLLRWRYPDLWHPYFGGEKPMEMAYANAVARSRWMPPYDPWYADGVQNYYYYGFFLTALLWKLSGLLPERAFQLTVATFAGLVAGTVVSLGMSLLSRIVARGASPFALSTERTRWIVAGGFGALGWALFAGNADALVQVLSRRSIAIDFWQSSRVVANAITEFPYFTFLYADVHPHLLSLPFWLALVGLVLAADDGHMDRFSHWIRLGTAILLGGTAAVANSWDLPLVLSLLVLFAFRSQRQPVRWRLLAVGSATAVAAAVLTRVLFLPFYDRFVSPVTTVRPTTTGSAPEQMLVHFGLLFALAALALVAIRVPVAGRHWLLGLSALGMAAVGYGSGVMLRGEPPRLVAPNDLWLPALLCVVALSVALGTAGMRLPVGNTAVLLFSLLLGVAVGLLGASHQAAALLLAVAVPAGIWILLSWRHPVAPLVTLWLVAVGLIGAAELFVIVEDLYGSPWERMNTVFKFYFAAWPLLALSGWGLAVSALHWLRDTGSGWSRRAVMGTLLVLICCTGILYPVLGTPARLHLRLPSTPSPGSLDGYAWMIGGSYANSLGEPIPTTEDWLVIQWLRQHVTGNPVILEASIGPYRGNGSRLSSATGLPTVLGWDRHERQQRTVIAVEGQRVVAASPLGDAVDRRLWAVRELYQTTDLERKRKLLYAYRVQYVIVGPVERLWRIQPGFAGATRPDELYAEPEGLHAFTALEGTVLRRVATVGQTIVYEVLPPHTE